MKPKENTSILFNDKSLELKEVLSFMGSVFQELHQDTEISSMLLESNIKNTLADTINYTLENPIKAGFDLLTTFENNFTEVINILILKYFNDNKAIIKEVYRAKNTGNVLHYSIILSQ